MDPKHYCTSCGRDMDHDYACLHHVKLTRVEVMIIYMMVILFPIILIPRQQLLSMWTWKTFLPSTSLALSILLFILTLLNIVFNRPYLALFFGCHQNKERSPKFLGRVWVLCMRCTGIYLGMFLMMFSYLIVLPFWAYILFSIPLVIDGMLQHKKILMSNALRRLLSGILFGFSLTFMINLMMYGMMWLSSWIVSLF